MRKKSLMVTAAIIMVGALLAGCSAGTSGGTTGGAAGGSTSAADTALKATAASKVAEFEAPPKSFPGPTDAFNPGTGKVAVMACGFAAAVCKINGDLAVKAFKAMGWDVQPTFDGQFSPQVEAGFMDRAVQDHLYGVVLSSVDVNTIQESVTRAAAAGLFIACVFCASGDKWKGKVTDITVDWKAQGDEVAWAIINNNGPAAKVVSFQDVAYPSTVLRGDGLEASLKSNCPNCTIQRELFASASISKPGPPEISAILASKPKGDITNLVLHYDGLGMAAAKTVADSGRTDISVSGYDADSVAANAILTAKPAPYAFSVAGPYNYAMWAAADLMARNKAGVPLWDGYGSLPSVLVNKSNASLYADATPGPANYEQMFEKLWGK